MINSVYQQEEAAVFICFTFTTATHLESSLFLWHEGAFPLERSESVRHTFRGILIIKGGTRHPEYCGTQFKPLELMPPSEDIKSLLRLRFKRGEKGRQNPLNMLVYSIIFLIKIFIRVQILLHRQILYIKGVILSIFIALNVTQHEMVSP